MGYPAYPKQHVGGVSAPATTLGIPAEPPKAKREAWLPMASLSHALALAFLVSLGLVAFVFFRLGGW